MSNSIYPALPGLMYPVVKTPQWNTKILKSVSGKEIRASYYQYPLFKFSLQYEFMRSGGSFTEYQQLFALYGQSQGQWDSFLFNDPTDQAAVAGTVATVAVGTNTYQLLQTGNSYSFPAGGVDTSSFKLYNSGVLVTSGYTLNANAGTITTTTLNPANLTWSGTYYHRVRFNSDAVDFESFMQNFWSSKKVELVTVR